MSDNENKPYVNPFLTGNDILNTLSQEFIKNNINSEEIRKYMDVVFNALIEAQNYRLKAFMQEKLDQLLSHVDNKKT